MGSTARANASGLPQPRLSAEDALSICAAMVAGDASLHGAATAMWKALGPFIAGLDQSQDDLARETLDVLADPERARHTRADGTHAARSDRSGVS